MHYIFPGYLLVPVDALSSPAKPGTVIRNAKSLQQAVTQCRDVRVPSSQWCGRDVAKPNPLLAGTGVRRFWRGLAWRWRYWNKAPPSVRAAAWHMMPTTRGGRA